MELYSDLGVFKQLGEIKTADDPRSVVGATVDKVTGNIIVTYSHVVQRVKLSQEDAQPDISLEWRTRYRLTSAVVFDAVHKYIAVCGGDTLRMCDDIPQIEAADKYTFQIPIFQILIRFNKDPLILFRNGDCVTLSYGLEHCGTIRRKAPLKESATIVEAASYTRADTDFVFLIVRDKDNSYSIVHYPLKDERCDYQNMRIVKDSDSRDCKEKPISVKGCCIVAGASENPSVCFTWSDGYVGLYNVIKNSWKVKSYPLPIRREFQSTLVCLKRKLILFYGKVAKRIDDGDNSSCTLIVHKSLWDWMGYRSLDLKPYSSATRAFDCDDYVVFVESSSVSVWKITVASQERLTSYHNDSKRLMHDVRVHELLPIFGNPRKINYCPWH